MCSFCQSLKDHISDNIYLINQLYNYCLIGVVPIHTMYKQYIYGCSPSSIGSIINVLPSFLINSINGFFLEIWMIPTSILLLFYWNLSEFFINKSDIELFDTVLTNANACIFLDHGIKWLVNDQFLQNLKWNSLYIVFFISVRHRYTIKDMNIPSFFKENHALIKKIFLLGKYIFIFQRNDHYRIWNSNIIKWHRFNDILIIYFLPSKRNLFVYTKLLNVSSTNEFCISIRERK